MRGKLELISLLTRSGSNPSQILVKLGLRKALLGCDSVLDIGSGVALTVRELGVKHSVGAEGYLPALRTAKSLNTHDEYVECDIRNIGKHFQAGQFDACIAMDVIEHLTKAEGLKLMADMERIARKRVVFFTPSGFLPQGNTESGDLQAHNSGWEPEEMEKLGYRVAGCLGLKKLRGEYHRLKYRPKVFWSLVSLFSQIVWTIRYPKDAAAILCVKKLDKA